MGRVGHAVFPFAGARGAAQPDAGASRAREVEVGAERLIHVLNQTRGQTAQEIVDAIFGAVQDFRGETPANDDMTAVVLRVTA